MSGFNVSVIIPVYNAEKYVRRAVLSALEQQEVKEVIVIDDGYDDSSYDICKDISEHEERVKLLAHDNNENQGASVSRNLGIVNSCCEYISFLDADDYYLPYRFKLTKELFSSSALIDGVYEPVGTEFSSHNAQAQFANMMRMKINDVIDFATYPDKQLAGNEFFESLIFLNNGWPPQTNGITLKRGLVSKVGLFNSRLRLHQDSEYWVRASYDGYFATPESRSPVAVRTMHDQNRAYAKNVKTKIQYYQALLSWASQVGVKKSIYTFILSNYQELLKAS